ncbi:sensor histidine kinase [Bacillus kexueae]|uniref:sensor histidine kinase n=1 Tax=Aeribacillus kexueae TaxID=2078952 RepID=UPI001FAED4AB|nr:sensor histidine kinase [Bacillus kexueae]
MNVIQRHLLFGVLSSLFMTACVLVFFFITYPIEQWSIWWKDQVAGVPLALALLFLFMVMGILLSLIFGWFWKKQFLYIDRSLSRFSIVSTKRPEDSRVSEVEDILDKIEKWQKQYQEQTKLAQKQASQTAEGHEKLLHETVVKERSRLARELHDSVSQQLFAASMLISAMNEMDVHHSPLEKQLKMVEQIIQQTQLEMRALLLHLRPVPLKGKSLQEGIEELLTELKEKVPLNVTWKMESYSFEKGFEDHLFRILQEAISNTLRHAKASNIHVLLIVRDQFAILRVVDDGIGFHIEESKTTSYGLQTMRERAIEMGGTFHVVSLPGKGTRLEVKIPILEGDND